MKTSANWKIGLIILAIVAAVAGSVINVVDRVADLQAPAWCSYPDPAGVAALQAAVAERVAEIGRYSPGQPVDRFTLQLDLMTRCAR